MRAAMPKHFTACRIRIGLSRGGLETCARALRQRDFVYLQLARVSLKLGTSEGGAAFLDQTQRYTDWRLKRKLLAEASLL